MSPPQLTRDDVNELHSLAEVGAELQRLIDRLEERAVKVMGLEGERAWDAATDLICNRRTVKQVLQQYGVEVTR